jgi:hypothetical protein
MSMSMRVLRCLVGALVLLVACPASQAAGVVIYRCTDAFGALTVQNDVPCPKGSHQAREVVQSPAPMPAYRPVPRLAETHVPAPSASEPAPQPAAQATDATQATTSIAQADRLPPPPLYRCNTFDNDSYLSEIATPAPRCVRMQTTDLSGNADAGAGMACQMVTDQCQRIADNAACPAWKQRLREAQSASTFAGPDTADAAKSDLERVQKIVNLSTCGG